MKAADVRAQMTRMKIKPSKKASQNFLICEETARKQVEAADIGPEDRVLEIGPGLGILTEHILEKTEKAVFIEYDKNLANFIKLKYGAEVMCGDALKVDWPAADIVISNLPYHISSEITSRILESDFKRAVLMYQKEFAEHLVAGPGSRDYSRISVLRNYYADVEILQHVSKNRFYPEPKVDSTVVKLKSRPPTFTPRDTSQYFDVVRILFSHKKRTVRNAILSEAGIIGIPKTELKEKLADLPLAAERAFKLSPENINLIADYLYEI